MNWGIVVDSTGDMTADEKLHEGIGFEIVPLKVVAGDMEFTDNDSLDIDELLKAMKNNKNTSTACPSVEEFRAAMEKYDRVICITVTSALSGTYNAACLAADMVMEAHPEKKVAVVDSKTVAGNLIMMVRKAEELIVKGCPLEEVVRGVEEYRKEINIVFTLSCYDNLIKTGRISPIVGTVAGYLGIRAVNIVTEGGTVEMNRKARGEAKAIAAMLDIVSENTSLDGKTAYISHCKNPEMACRVADEIRAKWNVKDIDIREARGMITFYAMPGGIVLSY